MSQNQSQPQLPGTGKQATTSQGPSPKERLKKCLETASAFFKSVPTEGEGRIWLDLLNLCSAGEIEEAFRQWHFRPWGDQWPRMPQPGEILELVGAAREKQRLETYGCSTEYKRTHDQGYGENDIRWLMKRRMKDAKPGEKWSLAQWEAALLELDSTRAGGAPKWRGAPGGQDFLREAV